MKKTEFSRSDKKWQSFNKKLEKLMAGNDLFGLGTTYYEMAYFLKAEGKEYKHLLDKGYEMKKQFHQRAIKEYKSSGYVTAVEVYANDGSCPECKQQSGSKMQLDQAISNPPIPIKECTFEPYGCRCTILPVRNF